MIEIILLPFILLCMIAQLDNAEGKHMSPANIILIFIAFALVYFISFLFVKN